MGVEIPIEVRRRRGLDAVTRLAKLAGTGKYMLGAGGTNPNSPTPFTWLNGVYGSDCSGAVNWAQRIPRAHPDFPEYRDKGNPTKGIAPRGHINPDSMLLDARLMPGGVGGGKFYRFLDPREPETIYPGCVILFPSIRAHEVGRTDVPRMYRVRIGHVGLVAGWDGLTDPGKLPVEDGGSYWDGDLKKLVTVECCSQSPAIRFGRNRNFLGNTTWRGHTNEAWGVRFVEYVGP